MSAANTTLIRNIDNEIPPTLRQVLRNVAIDKRTLKVELNIKDGRIRGFELKEHKEIPAHEI